MIPFDPKNIEHCDSLEYFIHYSRYPEYYYFDRMEYLNDGFRQYVGKHLNLNKDFIDNNTDFGQNIININDNNINIRVWFGYQQLSIDKEVEIEISGKLFFYKNKIVFAPELSSLRLLI